MSLPQQDLKVEGVYLEATEESILDNLQEAEALRTELLLVSLQNVSCFVGYIATFSIAIFDHMTCRTCFNMFGC